jgi:hypothetical protein
VPSLPRLTTWAVLLTSSVSYAAPVGPAKKEASPPEPSLPPAPVTLTITPAAGVAPWRLRIENKGELPIRIPAEPRLLVLELTPPVAEPDPADKKKKAAPAGPLRCILPDDTRPATDDSNELVIPASRAWSASFDPLFYCFGARERAALVAGTSIRARFGWPAPPVPPARGGAGKAAPRAPSPPFAVTPVGAAVGKVAPAKAIDADPFTLAATVASNNAPGTSNESATSAGDVSLVSLSVPEALDSARGVELGTTVTLTNRGDKPIVLLFRPEMLLFTVSGPGGSTSCGYPRQVSAPIRELFSTVPAKGKAEVGVLFSVTCSPGTFDQPGIYRVTPRLDSTGASGRSLGLKTWDGRVEGKAPLLLRVRTPRTVGPPIRPTLD